MIFATGTVELLLETFKAVMDEETLFHLVIQQPPGERGAYLDQACGGDDALRERVQVLLHAHEYPASFLESPATGLASNSVLDPPSPLTASGTVIGRYKLL